MMAISMSVNDQQFSAKVPIGATLRDFLEAAGASAGARQLLGDGQRVLSPELELAARWNGASLRTDVPPQHLLETPALTPDELLVAAEKL